MPRDIPPYYAIAAVTIALAVVFLVTTTTDTNTAGAAFESQEQTLEPLYLDFQQEYFYEYADLYWESNADTCIAYGDDWSGTRSAEGYEAVFPYETTTYTLECIRESDGSYIQETLEVLPVDEFYYDDLYYDDEYDPEFGIYY